MSEPASDVIEMAPKLETTASRILRDIFIELNASGVVYCVLSGCPDMPACFDSEVEMVIASRSLPEAVAAVTACASRQGWPVTSCIQRRPGSITIGLAGGDEAGRVGVLTIDLCTDYRYKALVYLPNETLLRDRRAFRGFFVPAPGVRAALLLAKGVLERTLRREQEAYLSRLYRENLRETMEILKMLWGHRYSAAIAKSLDQRSGALSDQVDSLRRELCVRAFRTTVLHRPSASLSELLRAVTSVVSPAGYVVAFLGPDGAGKTTVMTAVGGELTPMFRGVESIHLRPRLFGGNGSKPPVTDPHGKPNRPLLISLLKLAYYISEYIAGYHLRVRVMASQNRLVIFDRYYHDIVVDPRRYRFGAPLWIVRALGRFVPQPDCTIVLDADTDTLHSRKTEVSRQEALRQRIAYQALAESLPNSEVVDAARPVADVVASVNAIILNGLTQKASARLHGLGLR